MNLEESKINQQVKFRWKGQELSWTSVTLIVTSFIYLFFLVEYSVCIPESAFGSNSSKVIQLDNSKISLVKPLYDSVAGSEIAQSFVKPLVKQNPSLNDSLISVRNIEDNDEALPTPPLPSIDSSSLSGENFPLIGDPFLPPDEPAYLDVTNLQNVTSKDNSSINELKTTTSTTISTTPVPQIVIADPSRESIPYINDFRYPKLLPDIPVDPLFPANMDKEKSEGLRKQNFGASLNETTEGDTISNSEDSEESTVPDIFRDEKLYPRIKPEGIQIAYGVDQKPLNPALSEKLLTHYKYLLRKNNLDDDE